MSFNRVPQKNLNQVAGCIFTQALGKIPTLLADRPSLGFLEGSGRVLHSGSISPGQIVIWVLGRIVTWVNAQVFSLSQAFLDEYSLRFLKGAFSIELTQVLGMIFNCWTIRASLPLTDRIKQVNTNSPRGARTNAFALAEYSGNQIQKRKHCWHGATLKENIWENLAKLLRQYVTGNEDSVHFYKQHGESLLQ